MYHVSAHVRNHRLVTNAIYYSHLTAFLEFWSLIHLPWDYLLMFQTLPSFQQMV